jgi:hypothetical protein
MYNPRFPHSLRVWRVRKNAYGEPATDDMGHPIYDPVLLEKVVMENEEPIVGCDGKFETEIVGSLSFGYRSQDKATRDSSDVEVGDYKLATPMFLTPLDSSDRVELTDYDRTYWCEVVRKATYNLGSNIWVNEVKG